MRSPNIPGVADDLRQTQSTRVRRVAIVTFGRSLRREHLFQPIWDAVGGASGLAALMAEFSLRDVRAICHYLGRTASAQKGRPERQAGIAELVRILHEEGSQRDPRPLGQYYQDIVPACGLEVVREWDEQLQVEWSKFQRFCLSKNHREWYEKRFIQFLFPPKGAKQTTSFSTESRIFEGNLLMSEAIFSALLADKEGASRIPSDFMGEFVMPLLNRLFRRRRSDGETRNNLRDKFLYLTVQCIRAHESQFASKLFQDNLGQLLRYAVQRWSVARDKDALAAVSTQEQTELCLVRILECMPRETLRLRKLRQIFEMVLRQRKPQVDSYQLLRLILLHARDYEIDIDDNSPSTLAQLRDLRSKSNLWPMRLFLDLDVGDAIGLFEKLSNVHVKGDFLSPESSRDKSRTVMEQYEAPNSSSGDAEILRCLLYAKSPEKADDQSWRVRARSLVHERRQRSETGREWQDRAFWAKSAINLCVAAGDMELFDDTVLWVRRFNNQPLVVRDYYNRGMFSETVDLLSGVPEKDDDGEAASDERAAAVAKTIETSNRIILHFVETITMTMSQPQTQKQDWSPVLGLAKLVVDRRAKRENADSFDALFGSGSEGSDYPSSGVLEAVWKPTIDVLIRAEALLSGNPRLSLTATGVYAFQQLEHRCGGKARAELASFTIERIKTHLGPEGLRLRMQNVIEMVTSVAESDQPWLAIPFIRDLVLHGEGADSVWHRQLLSSRFLASLPSKSVKDLLYTMAEAIEERMREQNSRPRNVVGEDGKPVSAPSAVKVTTIKMIAQLLAGTQVIGPSAACDMLLGLLAEARHIDALFSIVSSLLEILKEPTYLAEVQSRIVDALEEKLAPVLSRLSERRPVSEEDWAAAESGEAAIPDVMDSKSPIVLNSRQDYGPLTALLLHPHYGLNGIAGEARERLVGLLVRAPAQSAANNARWNRLFLRRNDFHLADGESLPAYPASVNLLCDLLGKFPSSLPAEALLAMRDMALANLRPTPGVARVTAAVKADRDLLNSNAGAHWLAQWDSIGSGPARRFGEYPNQTTLRRFGVYKAAELLRNPAALAPGRGEGGGITVKLLSDTLLAVADRLISCELTADLEALVGRLIPSSSDSRADRAAWRENCVPFLRRLTEKVDGLRSGRAELPDGEPLPKVFPSSFQLRVYALSIPYADQPKGPAVEGAVEAFVAELNGLLDWMVARGMPYHGEFEQLKTGLNRRLRKQDQERVALCLGRLDGRGHDSWGVADYLRLELAMHFLWTANTPPEGDVALELNKMVREWVASDVEQARVMGMRLQERKKGFSESPGE